MQKYFFSKTTLHHTTPHCTISGASVRGWPILTKMYNCQWKRYVTRVSKVIAPYERILTLYGYVFNLMYKEV